MAVHSSVLSHRTNQARVVRLALQFHFVHCVGIVFRLFIYPLGNVTGDCILVPLLFLYRLCAHIHVRCSASLSSIPGRSNRPLPLCCLLFGATSPNFFLFLFAYPKYLLYLCTVFVRAERQSNDGQATVERQSKPR